MRTLALILVVLGGLCHGFAMAQDQTPLLGSQATDPQLGADPAQTELRRILVVGDQMAGGMGAGLTRMAGGDDTIEVVNRFNESSGLTRPEIYDWVAAIPKMAEGKNFAAAFVLIGLNDRRDMRMGDQVLPFGSAEWKALYAQHVDAMLDALRAQNIKVFWMGEPPMGDAGLDNDMQMLTGLIKERVAAKGENFIDLRAPFLGTDGKYTERGVDDTGADRRLRESDGITFFKMGNNRLGQIALAALMGVAAPSPDAVAPNAPDVIGPLAAVPPDSADQGTIFGQQGLDGTVVAHGSAEVAAAVAVDAASKDAAKASVIGVAAAKGSSAEALFTTGLAGAAPVGRFDDFTAPAGN